MYPECMCVCSEETKSHDGDGGKKGRKGHDNDDPYLSEHYTDVITGVEIVLIGVEFSFKEARQSDSINAFLDIHHHIGAFMNEVS